MSRTHFRKNLQLAFWLSIVAITHAFSSHVTPLPFPFAFSIAQHIRELGGRTFLHR